MQFTTVTGVAFNGKVLQYTGTVQELSYTTTRYISQYIPVQRFQNVAGPIVPNPNGSINGISKTTFGYSFDRGVLGTVGVTLQTPSTWSGSEAGF
jgi:hypothetical protein